MPLATSRYHAPRSSAKPLRCVEHHPPDGLAGPGDAPRRIGRARPSF